MTHQVIHHWAYVVWWKCYTNKCLLLLLLLLYVGLAFGTSRSPIAGFSDDWACWIGFGQLVRKITLIGCLVWRTSGWEEVSKASNDKVKGTNRRLVVHLYLICNDIHNPSSFSFSFWMINTDYCHLLVWRVILAQNVHAVLLLAVVYALCSSANCSPRCRQHEATTQLVSIATSSLKSVWCVWAFDNFCFTIFAFIYIIQLERGSQDW